MTETVWLGSMYVRMQVCVTVSAARGRVSAFPVRPVRPDLMLGGQLLHVGVKTPEARQEVIDHHLLGNDCRGSQGMKELEKTEVENPA